MIYARYRQGSTSTIERRLLLPLDVISLKPRQTRQPPLHYLDPVALHSRRSEALSADAAFTNRLPEDTTIHWHGLLLPNGMDGVVGLNQPPVKPGETYAYEFVMRKSGTFIGASDPSARLRFQGHPDRLRLGARERAMAGGYDRHTGRR